MNPVGVFFFLERPLLEACQLVCKLWHRAIEEIHGHLALRTLEYFWLYEQERQRQKVGGVVNKPNSLKRLASASGFPRLSLDFDGLGRKAETKRTPRHAPPSKNLFIK